MRDKILEEAVRLFAEKGYEGASVQAIADAVGIKKQSLFHYFKSKAELRKTVVNDLLDHWQKVLPRLLAEASSGYDRFSSTIEALVEFLLKDTNRARMAIREMLDYPEESRNLISERLKPFTTLLTNYIELGKQSALIKPDVNAESYIVLVMTMAIGTVALNPVTSAMTDRSADKTIEPEITELVRIARDSLFIKQTKSEK